MAGDCRQSGPSLENVGAQKPWFGVHAPRAHARPFEHATPLATTTCARGAWFRCPYIRVGAELGHFCHGARGAAQPIVGASTAVAFAVVVAVGPHVAKEQGQLKRGPRDELRRQRVERMGSRPLQTKLGPILDSPRCSTGRQLRVRARHL